MENKPMFYGPLAYNAVHASRRMNQFLDAIDQEPNLAWDYAKLIIDYRRMRNEALRLLETGINVRDYL